MISVGVDVSKASSTICILKAYGEIVSRPFEVQHLESDLAKLSEILLGFDEEVRVVMEATGIYHLPILTYLQRKGLFVAIINPYQMKKYRSQGLRRVKTDKHDSITISNFGIDHWIRLEDHKTNEDIYQELKLLGRHYRHFMKMRIDSVLELTHLLDYVMPGIKSLLDGWREKNGKDKLSDFVEQYWHYDNITAMTEKRFVLSYQKWTKKWDTALAKIKQRKSMLWQKKVSLHFLPIPHRSKCW